MLAVPENPAMLSAENEVRLHVSTQAYERIAAWVGQELRDDAYNGLIAAGVYSIFCIVVNGLIVLLLTTFVFQSIGRYALESDATFLISPGLALGVLCISYPIQYGIYRRSRKSIALQSGKVVLPRPAHEEQPDSSANGGFGLLLGLSAFPLWLGAMALRHGLAPWRAARADKLAMAHILVYLLEQSRRVSFFDVEDSVRHEEVAAALNVLVHLHGVLVWQREYPSISINDDLRAKLKQFL